MRKRTTHKIITNAVHIACLAAAVYIFAVWPQGAVTDAPQMLQYVAWVEITNLAQYSAKSGYDHKHGVFDNPIANAAITGMSMGDVGSAVTQVAQAVHDQREAEAQEALPDAQADGQGQNDNMAG